MPRLGAVELIIVFAIIVLFFGGKKLTELARGLGESAKELKKVGKELRDESDDKGAAPHRSEAGGG